MSASAKVRSRTGLHPKTLHRATASWVRRLVLVTVVGLAGVSVIYQTRTTICLGADAVAAAVSTEANWPRFRGPNGTGLSDDKNIPVTWTEDDYLWKLPLPDHGHSSPCVWNDQVFVTTSQDDGTRRSVLCIDAPTGEVSWRYDLAIDSRPRHDKNSHASESPATDGHRIYVAFSTDEMRLVLALDFSGNVVWKRELPTFVSNHGSGPSPVVFDDLVILANDGDEEAFVTALHSSTGEPRWKVARTGQRASFSTPVLVERPGVPAELIVSSMAEGVSALDVRNGKRHWQTDPLEARTIASPIYAEGLVFQTCGGGGKGHSMLALRPGGSAGGLGGFEVVWRRDRTLPYVPTPVAYDKYLFLWGDNGVVSCVEAATGENLWTDRVRGNFSGSPVCVDGKLYCMSEIGDVVVLRAGPEFEQLARNPLGDPSHSTPAVSNDRMFLRTFHYLFCVGEETSAEE